VSEPGDVGSEVQGRSPKVHAVAEQVPQYLSRNEQTLPGSAFIL
jgi:hypothetical protein